MIFVFEKRQKSTVYYKLTEIYQKFYKLSMIQFSYKKPLYPLLLNKNLLKLSYNQIVDLPENFIFDINLRYCVSRSNKDFLKHEIIESVQKEICVFFKKQTPISLQNNKGVKEFLKQSLLRQLAANVLHKIFKIIQANLPSNFKIVQNKLEAYQHLQIFLQKTRIGTHFYKSRISNDASVHFLLKSLNQIINDTKFVCFLNEVLFGATFYISLNKSSKFFQIICDIYLLQLDWFIISLCNKELKIGNNPSLRQSLHKKQVEFVVSKALILGDKIHLSNLRKRQSFNNLFPYNSNQFYYLRYLDNIFVAFNTKAFISKSVNLIRKTRTFCESFLHLDFKTTGWLNLQQHSTYFLGRKYIKKVIKERTLIHGFAPLQSLRKELFNCSITRKNNKPQSIDKLMCLYTKNIIDWYNYFFIGIVAFYQQTRNHQKLTYNLYYFLKWSLLRTLQKKHKKSIHKIIFKHSKLQSDGLHFLDYQRKVLITLRYIYNYSL